MGIPKFYRWLSERYPLLNQKFTATEVAAEIDNLYLDMNGIIHNCTHANQREVKMTEDEMMLKIFDYIDKLVQVIRPKKLLFMAIDGVAPRAKMNQQRSRRFKAAKERIELEAEKRQKGEEVAADPFDSNCITPGTPFMERLGKHLRFFIRRKISEDPLWQAPAVVFSGHDVPGEGEHKIMEYLRWEKRSPNYQPNQRHCLYGLDADLIMLSLVTHEPHFCLLREIVSYTGGNRGQPAREVLDNPCAENFILFHIGLLREYFEVEFKGVSVPFEPSGQINVERVVDDFVLFCMLVGNDFLPALPTLDINEGALNAVVSIYKKLLGNMGGYLTKAGDLDRRRFEMLLTELGAMEQEVLEERAKDAEYMEGKKAKRAAQNGEAWAPSTFRTGRSATPTTARTATPTPAPALGPGGVRQAAGPSGDGKGFGGPNARRAAANGLSAASASVLEEVTGMTVDAVDAEEVEAVEVVEPADATAAATPPPLAKFFEVIGAVGAVALEGDEEDTPVVVAEPTMMSREARQMMMSGQGQRGLQMWKDRWYNEKLQSETPAQRRTVVEAYVQGLHWVLEYYYRGVASWDWYYPYYFAPMASDLVDLPSITVLFTQGKPFRPYEQLLSVLPAASAKLLPPAYQPLMLSPSSTILDFYPTDFEVDMEGKRAAWEGVVKVPFVDEARLLKAVASVPGDRLTANEHERNKLGEILVFTHSTGSNETEYCESTMPQHFRDIGVPKSRLLRTAMPPPLPVGERGFTPTLVPGTLTGLAAPRGYPTLKSIQVRANLRNAGVNVLGTPSRKESVLLVLPDLPEGGKASAKQASILLGNRCYVNWPYLQEALIVRVSDATEQWYQTGHSQPQCKKWQSQEATKWRQDADAMASVLLTTRGLEIGRVDLVLHIKVCRGYVRNLDGTLQKQYSQDEVTFPLQCVLRSRPGPPAPTPAPGAAPAAASTEGMDADAPKLPELKEGDRAIFLGKGHYGAVCTILPDLGVGMTKAGKVLKAAGTPTSYRVSVQPLGPGGADPGARAARTASALGQTRYFPSHEVSRKLRINPRVLGRITGSVWATDGDDRYDLGVVVRVHSKGVCVPGFATPTPDGQSWQYSQAMIQLLADYQQAHPWLWNALAAQASAPDGAGHGLRLADILPDLSPAERKAKAASASAWVKASPLAAKPLVKANVLMMADEGIRALQLALPPPVHCEAEEFENVPPALLLPAFEPGPEQVKLAIQGGNFSLGDRVVCLLRAGIPQFGLRGTVIGIFDEALEVAFDLEFPGGTNLGGKVRGRVGAQVPKDIMLNISTPVTLPINKSAIPRPASATVTPPAARRSVSAAAAAGAAALARQVETATSAHPLGRHTASTPPPAAAAAVAAAVAATRTTSLPAGKRHIVSTSEPSAAVPSHAAPMSPAPPPPSSSMISRAASGHAHTHHNNNRAPTSLASKSHSAHPAPPNPPQNIGMQLLKQLQASSAPAAAPATAPTHTPAPAPPVSIGMQLLKQLESGKAVAAAAKATAPHHTPHPAPHSVPPAPMPLTESQVAAAHAHANAALAAQHAAHHAPPPPPPPGALGYPPQPFPPHPHHPPPHHLGHAPYMVYPLPPHGMPIPPPPLHHSMPPPPPMPFPGPGYPYGAPPPPPRMPPHAPIMVHAQIPPPPPPRPTPQAVASPASPTQPPTAKPPAKPAMLIPSHVLTTSPKPPASQAAPTTTD